MRELLALAQTAYDDGMVAHQGGSHDLSQEKFNEAYAHLSESEDVWRDQVLTAVPGRDESEREELANEHFGAIWDVIYKLKAKVRKMSTMR